MPKFTEIADNLVKRGAVWILRPVAALQTRLPQGVYVLLLATIVGVVTGTLAHILKWLITLVSNTLTLHLREDGANWQLILFPAVGIVLAACFQRYVLRHRIEHGTESLKAQLARQDYWLKPDLLYAPVAASTLTLGFGGSAGSEGPIAYTGAAIGSNLARACGFTGSMKMAMLASGAGAGIAGIFKSPVGGAMFSIEILRVQMSVSCLLMLFVACIVSALTAYLLSGCTPDVHFIPSELFDPSILPAIAVLGLFCGLYGSYYAFTSRRTRAFLDGLQNPWSKNILSGLGLGLLVFLFPVLYGEGYGVVSDLVNGRHVGIGGYSFFHSLTSPGIGLLAIVASIIAVKGIAATLTNSGGGVAGDFAPTLFAGAMAGYFFACVANMWLGLGLDTGVFALTAMSGTMAAVLRAPIMAIFLTAEMTWNYEYFLPIAMTAIIAYFVASMFDKRPHS